MVWSGGLFVALSTAPGQSPRDSVAVVPVRDPNGAETKADQPLQEALEAAMRRAGFNLTTAPERCAEPGCYAASGEATPGHGTLVPTVQLDGSDYSIRVEFFDAQGALVREAEKTCDICRPEEAAEMLAQMALGLLPEAEPEPEPEPTAVPVLIESTPSGADLSVDGEVVGQTPYRGEVEPGEHGVAVRKKGYETSERQLMVAGDPTSMRLDLQRQQGGRTLEIVGWSMVGVGVAALAGGIALLVIDGRPIESDCGGENVDPFGTCKYRRKTLVGGALLTAAGVASTGAGVGLVVWERRKRKRRLALGVSGLQGQF